MTATTYALAPRTIRDLVDSYTAPAETERITRRWGFEIETPDVSPIAGWADELGFTACHDSSVTAPDCDCDCENCAHSCDCENCEITNGYRDNPHCDYCGSNEIASPVLHTASPDHLRELLSDLHQRNTEDLENGGHIHIEARDLTISQIGLILKAFSRVKELTEEIWGRDYVGYAYDPSETNQSANLSERFCAVNCTNLVRYSGFGFKTWAEDADRQSFNTLSPYGKPMDSRKSTLEFRLPASTARASLIFARGALLRALVDYFANGGALYWVVNCKTERELLELLEPERH